MENHTIEWLPTYLIPTYTSEVKHEKLIIGNTYKHVENFTRYNSAKKKYEHTNYFLRLNISTYPYRDEMLVDIETGKDGLTYAVFIDCRCKEGISVDVRRYKVPLRDVYFREYNQLYNRDRMNSPIPNTGFACIQANEGNG